MTKNLILALCEAKKQAKDNKKQLIKLMLNSVCGKLNIGI